DQTIGSLAGSGSIDLGNQRLAAGSDNSSTTFAGTISGNGGLSKLGTGTLLLSGSNSQSGITRLQAGTLALDGGSAQGDTTALDISAGATLQLAASETIGSLSGAGAIALGEQRLTVNAGTDSAFSGAIAGGTAGALTKTGAATLTLGGNGDWGGETRIDG
ncbi:autotransporter-associated beta strand repeat-containing protein, partial [Pelomonas sp. KK5]|uniref:autotransporter-associated beta strand repeat-containing protein n=1 Tax=Pelomonas sp. KK5 TaxID=1855730 RepID=UPI0018E95F92